MGAFRRTSGMHPFFYLNPMKMFPLRKQKRCLCRAWMLLWGCKYITFVVQVYNFLNVATRLIRRAEPSQHVC